MSKENRPKPVVLLVIDGFGLSKEEEGNAILGAETPNIDRMMKEFPWVELEASGIAVGLPEGVMGNSEVGHLTIGIGRILFQSYEKINQSIKKGELAENKVLLDIIDGVNSRGKALHFFGLVSDGGVHSHIKHLKELIRIAHRRGVKKVFVHAFTDGRDVPPTSSDKYIKELLDFLRAYDGYELADIVGRYYAMDRDKRWERTQVAYDMLVKERTEVVEDPVSEIRRRFADGETDEFLRPILCSRDGVVRDGDGIIFFNFRPDRARQLTTAFTMDSPVKREREIEVEFATMTEYDENYTLPVLFPSDQVSHPLAQVYADAGLRQIHIAETEKYAHVTYFINGGEETPFENEDRVLIPSNKSVATYDLAPEMATEKIADAVIDAMRNGQDGTHKYDLIVFNIAAPDMVGHTGNYEATLVAVEATDKAIGRVLETAKEQGYIFAITADHGNAEKMRENGKPHTAHTTNKVPFILTVKDIKLREGGLSNVVPTILDLVGLEKPVEMSGESLLIRE